MSPILQTLVLIFSLLPNARSYTIIVSDSNNQSDLVDGPQNGLPLSKNRARTDAREQEAVYDIMRATGNYWATDIPDVCRGRWHGIECMPDKDNVLHVVSLSFGALSDDTAFPVCDPTKSYLSESIAKLPRLKSLFFYRCFTYNPQPIPSFLGQLGPSLQTLVLRENGHVGPIPNELGNLTHLKTLDLHHNDLNGSIPVSLKALTGLRTLDLSNNKLTGPIPDGSFPDLSILDLSQNLLDGSIPPVIGSWQSLIKMDASRNRLTGSIPESIGRLKELILLDLSYNRLSKPLPPSIRNLTSLQAFMLKGNPMSSVTLSSVEFDCMKSLIILVLSNVGLNGPIPESLGRLTNLRVVHLDGNRFNGSIPTNFKELRNLAELRLNDNQLSGPIPFGKDLVWRMKRKLKLQNNMGLCYGANTGLDDDMNMDIGLCSNSVGPVSGSAKTVQHVSVAGGDLTGARIYLNWEKRERDCWAGDDFFFYALLWQRIGSNQFFVQEREREQGTWRIFSLKELLAATNNFNYDNKLGEGGFGSVYWGQLWDGSQIAVKRLKVWSNEAELEFRVEIEVLGCVRHKNLLRLRGYCAEGQERLIVFDYMPNLSLVSHLHGQHSAECLLDWKRRMNIAIGSAEGIAYLHHHATPRIIHRDVKASIVLLDSDFRPHVAGFGFAKLIPDGATHVTTRVKGTLGYLAPEYAMLGKASESCDVYSFGILLLELVSGKKPIEKLNVSTERMITDWALPLACEGKFSELADPRLNGDVNEEELKIVVLVALVCAQIQPERRPTMLEVLELLKGEANEKLAELENDEIFKSHRPTEFDGHDSIADSADFLSEEKDVKLLVGEIEQDGAPSS